MRGLALGGSLCAAMKEAESRKEGGSPEFIVAIGELRQWSLGWGSLIRDHEKDRICRLIGGGEGGGEGRGSLSWGRARAALTPSPARNARSPNLKDRRSRVDGRGRSVGLTGCARSEHSISHEIPDFILLKAASGFGRDLSAVKNI